MDMSTVVSLIGSLGFPIVMCLLMVDLLKKSEDSHKTEIDSLKDAFNANTQVLTELKTMFRDFMRKDDDSNATGN